MDAKAVVYVSERTVFKSILNDRVVKTVIASSGVLMALRALTEAGGVIKEGSGRSTTYRIRPQRFKTCAK